VSDIFVGHLDKQLRQEEEETYGQSFDWKLKEGKVDWNCLLLAVKSFSSN
jgi:hypothetical protein